MDLPRRKELFQREIIHFFKEKLEQEVDILSSSNSGVITLQVKNIPIVVVLQSYGSITETMDWNKLRKEFSTQSMIWIGQDQWEYQNEIVTSRLRSLMGHTKRIHGRQTKIRKLNKTDALQFLEQHHLQVPIPGKYKYGLFLGEELVAVMVLSRKRMIDRAGVAHASYELMRFCNKRGTTVVGGMSKLLKHFIREVQPDDIMSYVDRDWSDGKTYVKQGFEFQEEVPPMFFWVHPEEGKRWYPQFLPEELQERNETLEQKGYVRMWNSGSLKYLFLR
ncbi:hypothetical protein [Algivirga pacifica]|uniref:N-acetyltransferase domain-containing protein n=1 Tax=Algivirga pacifica TaxID=1162670 RepID=A0ABP9D6D2_9BACT